MTDFSQKSIARHTQHIDDHFSADEQTADFLSVWADENHPILFLHQIFWKKLDPLVRPGQTWLTVGDLRGSDAHYLKKKGADPTASDLGDTHLKQLKAIGFIEKYSVENVERLSFADGAFEYVLCKESYHHFPRPAIGFYEMLRVAKTGVVILEPIDILSKMPLVLFMKNILDSLSPNIMKKLWRNQYSYETVGNFVFKVSEREFEKMACALDLPAIAFKGFHVDKSLKRNSWVLLKLFIKNTLSSLKLFPFEQLATVVFKSMPDKETINKLKADGYRFITLPKNPYL